MILLKPSLSSTPITSSRGDNRSISMVGSRNENIIIEENDENTVEVKITEFLLKYY